MTLIPAIMSVRSTSTAKLDILELVAYVQATPTPPCFTRSRGHFLFKLTRVSHALKFCQLLIFQDLLRPHIIFSSRRRSGASSRIMRLLVKIAYNSSMSAVLFCRYFEDLKKLPMVPRNPKMLSISAIKCQFMPLASSDFFFDSEARALKVLEFQFV